MGNRVLHNNKSQTHYDDSTGQYYTVDDSKYNSMNPYSYNNNFNSNYLNQGKRNYLPQAPQSSPLDALMAANTNMRTNSPSLSELFPSLYGQESQAPNTSSLLSLLAPVSAASSGAGRFM